MKAVQKLKKIFFMIVPLLIFSLLLPFLLAFDSIMYWVTRPTCLNCGSIADYLRTSSLSAGMAVGVVGSLGGEVQSWLRSKGIKMPTHAASASSVKMNTDYQLKEKLNV